MKNASVTSVTKAEVTARFRATPGIEYDLKAFGFTLFFYAVYAAVVLGALNQWLFLAIGPLLVIRSFNALHETFHVRKTSLAWMHWLPIVIGPVQPGYDQYRRSHLSHHAHQGREGDIDAYLVHGTILQALFHAATQPEQALFRYLKHRRFERRLLLPVFVNASLLATALAVGWGSSAIFYLAATRVGNTFTWFVFHWVLHRPAFEGGLGRIELPGWFRAAWLLSLGSDSLKGSTHHQLHHIYPSVPDRMLPEVLDFIAGSAGAVGRSPAWSDLGRVSLKGAES